MAFGQRRVAVACLLFCSLTAVLGAPTNRTLEPFTAVSVCTPFNVKIAPAAAGQNYTLTVDADTAVAQSISAVVVGGVLILSTRGEGGSDVQTFSTQAPIKVTVSLPSDRLQAVSVTALPSIAVAVGPGFSTASFRALLAGTSSLDVVGLNATAVRVDSSGTGQVVVSGSIGSAEVATSGTGEVYVIGVRGNARVEASGITKVYVSTEVGSQITGSVSGISTVFYDRGTCSVTSAFGGLLSSPCQKQTIVPPSQMPVWTCGVTVSGSFGCSADGSSAAADGGSATSSSFAGGSSSSVVSTSSTSSTSSFSSGGSTTSSSTTSNGDGSSTTTTFSSGGGNPSTFQTSTGKLVTQACGTATSQLSLL